MKISQVSAGQGAATALQRNCKGDSTAGHQSDAKTLEHELRILAGHALDVANKMSKESVKKLMAGETSSIQRARPSNFISNVQLRQFAISEYRARQSRSLYFHSDFFSEAGWNMLLDLLVAKVDGRAISVTSACIASMCPATTALRWLSDLVAKGLITREDDPADHRRAMVNITESAVEMFRNYFKSSQFYANQATGWSPDNEIVIPDRNSGDAR